MKRLMNLNWRRKRMMRVLILLLVATFTSSQAMAIGELKKEWANKFAADKESDFSSTAKKAGCYVCHVKGVKDKKTAESRNEYGKAMSAFLESKDMTIDALKAEYKEASTKEEAIKKMLFMFEKVGEEKSKDGESFSAKIKAGKLPATDANL